MRQLITFLLLMSITVSNGQVFTKLKTFDNISFGNTGYKPVAAFDDKLCFLLGNPSDPHDLYITDGTEGGTRLLETISQFDYFESFANQDPAYLYFVKTISGPDQDEIVRMNKTSYELETISKAFQFSHLAYLNGKLYFLSSGDLRELDPGSQQVKTIVPNLVFNTVHIHTVWQNKIVLIHRNSSNQVVLTISDGTTGGTVTVKNFGIDVNASSSSSGCWIAGDKIYFALNARYGGTWDHSLWVSDGTESGTRKLKNVDTQFNGSDLLITGIAGSEYFYFRGTETGSGHSELFRTDGTAAGTVKIGEDRIRSIEAFVNYRGKTYVTAKDPGGAGALFRVEGDEVTGVFTYNEAGVDLSGPFVYNDSLFFTGNNAEYGSELWKTDGTQEGLTVIDQGNKAQGASMYQVTASGKYIYYTKRFSEGERELWVYDPKKYVNAVKTKVEELTLYPNPATSHISIPAHLTGGHIELVTLSGQRIYHRQLKDNRVDITALSPGVYLVRIMHTNKIYHSRFIKI